MHKHQLKRKRGNSRPLDNIYKNNDGFITCEFQADLTDATAVERFWYLCRLFLKVNAVEGIEMFYPVVCMANEAKAIDRWKTTVYIPIASILPEAGILVLFKRNEIGVDRSITSWSMLGCIYSHSAAMTFAHVIGYGKMVLNRKIEEDYKCVSFHHLKSNITALIEEAHNGYAIDIVDEGCPAEPIAAFNYINTEYIHLLFFVFYDLKKEMEPDMDESGISEFVTGIAINLRLDCLFVNYKKRNITQWQPFARNNKKECMFADFLICIIACVFNKITEMYINGYTTWAAVAMKKMRQPHNKQQSFLRNGFTMDEATLRDKYNQNCVGYFRDLVRQRCLDNIRECKTKYKITSENPTGIFGTMDETRYGKLSALLKSILKACEDRLEQ